LFRSSNHHRIIQPQPVVVIMVFNNQLHQHRSIPSHYLPSSLHHYHHLLTIALHYHHHYHHHYLCPLNVSPHHLSHSHIHHSTLMYSYLCYTSSFPSLVPPMWAHNVTISVIG